jgi:pimeloyl-ACP methyl ester carboxylesterase
VTREVLLKAKQYGFSDRPAEKGMTVARIAGLLFRLMKDELGYRRFAVRGSDIGAGVAIQLGPRAS